MAFTALAKTIPLTFSYTFNDLYSSANCRCFSCTRKGSTGNNHFANCYQSVYKRLGYVVNHGINDIIFAISGYSCLKFWLRLMSILSICVQKFSCKL